jgi:hypothetical protein
VEELDFAGWLLNKKASNGSSSVVERVYAGLTNPMASLLTSAAVRPAGTDLSVHPLLLHWPAYTDESYMNAMAEAGLGE